MNKVEGDQPIDPNLEAYQRLKEAGELPEGQFISFVNGELITSGDDRLGVVEITYQRMAEKGIDSSVAPMIHDRTYDDRVLHFRSPRRLRES